MKEYKEKDAEKIKKRLQNGATVPEIKKEALKYKIPLNTLYSWAKEVVNGKVKDLGSPELVEVLNEEEEKILKTYDQLNARIPLIIGNGVKQADMFMTIANIITHSVLKTIEKSNVPDYTRGSHFLQYEPHLKLAVFLTNSSSSTIKCLLPDIDKDFAERVQKIFDKYGHNIFMVGSRKDMTLNVLINTPETYHQVLGQEGFDHNPFTSSDIFIASKDIWRQIAREMPLFLLGRFCWDNWLHAYAERKKFNKLNCTDELLLLHCEHGYAHIEGQENAINRDAASIRYNVRLLGRNTVPDITDTIKWPKVEI